ncbi:unnamed protein product [Cyclocybe aegerita]|uniref:Uncharacterized protein n=1 Tax=Cyclocybe aegerita TaxID=1973307 RepID=A0A8S0W6Y3_CYCAE|nr:unnamed protein product [Cyclocybe aegerita]
MTSKPQNRETTAVEEPQLPSSPVLNFLSHFYELHSPPYDASSQKTEDFRPNIAFAYNADVEPENISVTEHHTFTVSSTAEVEEEKGFYSTVYAAASKKVKTLAGYIKSASRFCGFYSSSMVS